MTLGAAAEEKSVPITDAVEKAKQVEMRMWCIGQSVGLAIALTRAGNTRTLDVMNAADEMYEFLQTGVARTHGKTTGKAH